MRRAQTGVVVGAVVLASGVGLLSPDAFAGRPTAGSVAVAEAGAETGLRVGAPSPSPSATPSTNPSTNPSASPSAGTGGRAATTDGKPVLLAFAGDVHFEGTSRAALGGDLGSAASVLAAADVAVVNLETAVTTRGTPVAKKYVFRAPPSAFGALRAAGVDAVTVANNHGMDYGRVGLSDTLAAGARYGVPVLGAGKDVRAAFTPYRTTVRGVRIAVLAATDVIDTEYIAQWTATTRQPGLASVKDPARLLAAVRAARRSADVVVVVLHWGVELQSCPTARQRSLAAAITGAGADVVVGSHAHVLEPQVRAGRGGRALVHYGLGNFVFYASGGVTAQSGVLTVAVDRGGVRGSTWTPAVIRSGRPQLLDGAAARQAAQRQASAATRCGLA